MLPRGQTISVQLFVLREKAIWVVSTVDILLNFDVNFVQSLLGCVKVGHDLLPELLKVVIFGKSLLNLRLLVDFTLLEVLLPYKLIELLKISSNRTLLAILRFQKVITLHDNLGFS